MIFMESTKGTLLSVNTSARKGHSKTPVGEAMLVANHGIPGDVHAGPWHRQLSLLALADIDYMRARGISGLRHGSFAENLVVDGIDFTRLGPGSRLRIGPDAEIGITQIGKECHAACAIMAKIGECIMPTRGLFARVLRGGRIASGDTVEVLPAAAPASTDARAAVPEQADGPRPLPWTAETRSCANQNSFRARRRTGA
jgi:MOSC domain-containing protein YiiM